MRFIDDVERRARLARRHALGPVQRVRSPEDATRAVVALHATDPATPFLSINARVDGCSRERMNASLITSRTLVKQLAMRRTVFVFPREDVVPVLSAPAARVAGREKARLIKDIQDGVAEDAQGWLAAARAAVLEELEGAPPTSTRDLRERLGALTGRVWRNEGKPYGGVQHIAPQVVSWLGAAGDLARAGNAGHWRVNRILWARMDDWLGEPPARIPQGDAYRLLVEKYLRSFGPATETDLVWWFGATRTAMRTALSALGAVQVRLERGRIGWVLPDDTGPEPPVEPWAALLPPLDPTSLGWKDRDFYLPPGFAPQIFDPSGNCGPTAWWNGQIVGSYLQDDTGHVALVIGRDPGRSGRLALEAEARRLETWLDGERVNSAYRSPIARNLR